MSTQKAERLTLVERVIDLIPLPYIWAALLVAAILGAPGSHQIAYLETRDPTRSETAFFSGYMPQRWWQRLLTVILWFAFYAALLWTIRHARQSVLRAKPALNAILPEDSPFDKIFEPVTRVVPALILGFVLEALFVTDYRMRIAGAPGPISGVYEIISGPPLYLMAGTAIWVHTRAVWGLYQLGRGPLKLTPFHKG